MGDRTREQQREERKVLFPYSYMVASISLNWSFDWLDEIVREEPGDHCWADIRLPWWKRSGSLRVSPSENLYINPPSPFLDSVRNEDFFFPFRVRFFVTLPSFSDGRIVLFQYPYPVTN